MKSPAQGCCLNRSVLSKLMELCKGGSHLPSPRFVTCLWYLAFWTRLCVADVVINEIHYNPIDVYQSPGELGEFIELFNPGPNPVDISGYEFDDGIEYTFPAGTIVGASSYVIVVRTREHHVWYRLNTTLLGPYDGSLSNTGENVRLSRPDGTTVEEVRYFDIPPWPTGADGYGPSLERISPDLPAGEFSSWRASFSDYGTPKAANSVTGTIPLPLISHFSVDPRVPSSSDEVTVRLGFYSADLVDSATLQWERWEVFSGQTLQGSMPMTFVEGGFSHQAILPPMPSQSLVRFNLWLRLVDGRTLVLPHGAERRPFESYFVYDGEIDTGLPLLWQFPPQATALLETSREVSGVVFLFPGETQPQVFDGALVIESESGEKIRFIKGEEFRGDRTLNLSPESPTSSGSARASSPFREYLAFGLFADFGVLTPRTDWFRVVGFVRDGTPSHTQRLSVQQVNEAFLEMNGRSSEGFLYKREKSRWETHIFTELYSHPIIELVNDLSAAEGEERRAIMDERMNLPVFQAYSVASVFLTNWDGFHNNHWMYKGPDEGDLWEIYPWDVDKTWGFTDGNPMEIEMPPDYPITGLSVSTSRPPGPETGPMHRDEQFHQEYLYRLRYELDRTFSQSRLLNRVNEMETLLLEDLDKIEDQMDYDRSDRREQIQVSCDAIETYIPLRWEFLDGALDPLPTPTLTPTITPTPSPTWKPECDSGYYLLDSLGGRHRVGNPFVITGPLYFGTDIARDMERSVCTIDTATHEDFLVLDGFGAAHSVAGVGCSIDQDFYFGDVDQEAFPKGRAVDLEMTADHRGFWVLTDFGGIYRAGTARDADEPALVPNTNRIGVLGADIPFGELRAPSLADPGGASLRAVSLAVIDSDRDNAADGYIVLDSQAGRFHLQPNGTPFEAGVFGGFPENHPFLLLDPSGYVWPFFRGLDIARDAELHSSLQGVVILDGWNGIHPVPVDVEGSPIYFANNRVSNLDDSPVQAVGMPYVVHGYNDPETEADESNTDAFGYDAASIFTDLEFIRGCPNGMYTLDKFGGVFALGAARLVDTEVAAPFGNSPYFFPYLYAEDIEVFGSGETEEERLTDFSITP